MYELLFPRGIYGFFSPVAIRSVLLNAPGADAWVRFYQRFLGPPIQREDNRTWFRIWDSYLGVQPRPKTDVGAIHQLGIAAQRFDANAAIQTLEKLGAIDVRVSNDASEFGPRKPGPQPKVLSFSDPDGLVDGFRFEIVGV